MAAPILVPFARFAVPLMFGAFLGYAFRDHEAEEEALKRAKMPDNEKKLRDRLRQKGRQALYSWDDESLREEGLGAYLTYVYKALWQVGRSGTRLKDDYADRVALRLGHIHTLYRPRKDKPIADWMKDRGYNNEHNLSTLLSECKEIKELGIDPRYIGFALGEDYEDLSFGGLADELVKMT